MKHILFLLLCSSTIWAQSPVSRGHAHNDYEHEKPFYEAFRLGFGSIESDVYAVQGQLLVAHDVKDLKASRTLENLYIEPIMRELRAENAGNFHQFLIDCKTPADSTLPLIINVLEPYKDLIIKNKLRIVISGNRPAVADYIKYPSWITFDGRSKEPVPSFLASHVELESEAFYTLGLWNGLAPMSAPLRSKVQAYVDRVHAAGRVVRLWATPETILSYQTLREIGVDYIGTDHLAALADFLRLAK